jgi:hypothetical protein
VEHVTDYERIPLNRSGNVCQRSEVASFGVDENLQLVGDGPFSPQTSMGLRVPTLATPAFGNTGEGKSPMGRIQRYLFCLASITIGAHQRRRIVGLRQFWSMGALAAQAPNRLVEFPVDSTNFRLTNSNVSWHLRKMAVGQFPYTMIRSPGAVSRNASNFMFRWSNGAPALLYETAGFPAGNLDANGRPDYYITLNAYTPPNQGKPYGEEAIMGLGNFNDLRFPWNDTGAWGSLGACGDCNCFEGPCQIVFFASVRQTDTTTLLTMPAGAIPNAPNGYMPLGIVPEDQFIMNAQQGGGAPVWPVGPKIWRVAGAILSEDA